MALDAGKVVAILELDTSKFSGGINTAKTLMGTLKTEGMSAAEKIRAVGSAMASVGKTIYSVGKTMSATLTLPIVAAGTAAVKTFMSFDDAIRQVQATMGLTAEKGAAEIGKLTDAAKEMGATTRYTASQAAEALNYLALAGYDADKAISALPTVLNLAQAGGLDLGYASDLVTDSMAALGLEMDRLTGFSDELAKTSQKSNTNVAQLGEAILTVGGTAKNLAGGTIELNTALGILADNGIKSAEGGTALRNIILSLTAPTSQAAKEMKKLGLQVYDAEGDMRGLNDIFADLDRAMTGWTQKQRTDLFSTIFNNRDLKSAEALMANYGARWDELSGHISDANGAASQMAETMEGGIGGSFRNLSSAIEGLAIEFGENLAPTVQMVADFVTELVRGFTALPEATQSNIVNIAALVAALGPLLMVGGKILHMLGALAGAMTSPLGWVALGVAGIAALILAFKNLSLSADEALEKSMRHVNQDELRAYRDAYSNLDTTIEMGVTIEGDPEAQVQMAIAQLKKALLNIDVLTDEERDAIVAMIGGEVDPIIQALTDAGVDISTDEGATVAATIISAATQLKEAISGIDLFEGEDGAKNLAALIDADKATIMAALTESGMSEDEANAAADAIIAAGGELTSAVTGLKNVVPGELLDEITASIATDKSALVTTLQGLGLSDDDIAAIVQSLTTAQDSITGKVSSLYGTIYDKLTDGKPDTKEQTEELKRMAQDYYDELVGAIELDTQTKLGALDSALAQGTITLEEYNAKAAEVRAKNDDLMGDAKTLLDETTTYITTMSGKSTSAVEQSYEQLDGMAQRSRELYGEIMGMVTEASASNQNLSVRMVKAGVTTAPEKVVEAFGVTQQEYGQEVYNAQEKADERRNKAYDRWGAAEEEYGRIDNKDERERMLAEAKADLDETIAAIDQSEVAAISNAESTYKKNLNELFRGIAQQNPEIAARLREMFDDIDLANTLQGLTDKIANGEMLTEREAEAIQQALGDGLLQGIDAASVQQMLNEGNGAGAILDALNQLLLELPDQVSRDLEGMDTGSIGVAAQTLIEQGLLSGIESMDLSKPEDMLRLMLGLLDVPEPQPVEVRPEVEVSPEVDASGVSDAVEDAVKDAANSTSESITVNTPVNADGAGVVSDFADDIRGGAGEAANAASSVATAAAAELGGQYEAAKTAGANLGLGFASGIDSKLDHVIARAAALARAAISAINKEADINSPSKKTMWSGEMIGEGPIVGMRSKLSAILEAGREVGAASVKGMQMASSQMKSTIVSDYRNESAKPMHTNTDARTASPAENGDSPRIAINVNNPVVRSDADARKLTRTIDRYRNQVNFGFGGRPK